MNTKSKYITDIRNTHLVFLSELQSLHTEVIKAWLKKDIGYLVELYILCNLQKDAVITTHTLEKQARSKVQGFRLDDNRCTGAR